MALGEGVESILGFDVSQGVASLQSLIAALNGYNTTLQNITLQSAKFNAANQIVQATITGITSANQKFTAALKQTQQGVAVNTVGLQQLGQNLQNIGQNFQNVGNIGHQSGQRVLLSWQSVFRIFAVQVLHTIIGQLILAFRNAIEESAKFQIAIAEIRTITQDAQIATEVWSRRLRDLSSAFGKPALDVAEAAYQAISNQVVRGAETFQFLTKALEFGRAAVVSTADSVNLLSSVLNSFQLNVAETDRISTQLFKTIELGRLRGVDLANQFGRVGPTAHQLGITLEEVLAAIQTITIQGVKVGPALSFLENLFLKLVKPGKEMVELFKEWGVTSGEAAIATFGFEGVLKKLEVATKGDAGELGELLRSIRAIQAGFILAGTGANTFSENVKKTKEASESAKKAVDLVSESLGTKFREAQQTIKNAFLDGGIARGVENAIILFAKLLNATGLSLQGITSEFEKNSVKIRGSLDKAFTVNVEHFNDQLRNTNRAFGIYLSNIVSQVQKWGETSTNITSDVVNRIARATGLAVNFVAKILDGLEGNEKKRLELVEKTDQAIKDIAEKSAGVRFQLELRNIETLERLRQQETARRQQEFIRQQREETTSKIRELERQHAEQIKREGKFDNDLLNILKKRQSDQVKAVIDLEQRRLKEFRNTELQKEKEAANSAVKLQNILSREAALSDRDIAARNRFFQFDPREINLIIARINELKQRAKDLLDVGQLGKATSLFEEANKLAVGLEEKFPRVRGLAEQLYQAETKALEQFKRTAEEGLIGDVFAQKLIKSSEDIRQALKKIQDETNQSRNTAKELSDEFLKGTEGARNQLLKFGASLGTIAAGATGQAGKVSKSIAEIAKEFQQLKPGDSLGAVLRDFDKLSDELDKVIRTQPKGFAVDFLNLRQQLPALRSFIESLDATNAKFSDQTRNITTLEAQVEGLQNQLRNLPVSVGVLGQSFQGFSQQSVASLQLLTNALGNFAIKLEEIARRLNEINSQNQQLNVPGQSQGGPVLGFARGGFVPRGTDTVPAMLTPGEFVINAESSRRFFSQLVAINSGRVTRMDKGGVVTNVGDINVNVHGGNTAEQTVRTIGKKLQREIRRQTIRLN